MKGEWSDTKLLDYVERWQGCTLPLADWSPHGTHLAVTVWHLKTFPFDEALERMRTGIQRYNASVGKTAAYHETVTCFYTHMVHKHLNEIDANLSIAEAANRIVAILDVDKERRNDLWAEYYSDAKSVLASDEARHTWIPPDLKPL